jgi:hypothetical protein
MHTSDDRLQFEDGAADTHWLDLLDSRMQERVVTPAVSVGVRAGRKNIEFEVLRRAAGLPPQEQLAVCKLETGKSQAALYRRLAELGGVDSQNSHFSPA